MWTWRSATLSLLFLPAALAAQAPGGVDTRVFYYPKPLVRTAVAAADEAGHAAGRPQG